jgi:hypothetical protein
MQRAEIEVRSMQSGEARSCCRSSTARCANYRCQMVAV